MNTAVLTSTQLTFINTQLKTHANILLIWCTTLFIIW